MIELYNLGEITPRMYHFGQEVKPLLTAEEAEKMAEYLKENPDKIDESITLVAYLDNANRVYLRGKYKNTEYELVYDVDGCKIVIFIRNIKQNQYVVLQKDILIPDIKDGIDEIKEMIDTGRYM